MDYIEGKKFLLERRLLTTDLVWSSGINSIVEDNDSGIWLGSNAEGLLYVPSEHGNFFSSKKMEFQSKKILQEGKWMTRVSCGTKA